jgi:hypothetical protein
VAFFLSNHLFFIMSERRLREAALIGLRFGAACFLRSAQRFFIISESRRRPAGVMPPPLRVRTGLACFVPAGRPRRPAGRELRPSRAAMARSRAIALLVELSEDLLNVHACPFNDGWHYTLERQIYDKCNRNFVVTL